MKVSVYVPKSSKIDGSANIDESLVYDSRPENISSSMLPEKLANEGLEEDLELE